MASLTSSALRMPMRPCISGIHSSTLLLRNTYATSIRTKKTNSDKTPQPPSPATPTLPLTQLPYFIHRTASNQLPVYKETKSGGTLKQTVLRKTDGDVHALKEHLRLALGIEERHIKVNPLNGHVVMKGWLKPQIQEFLTERKF